MLNRDDLSKQKLRGAEAKGTGRNAGAGRSNGIWFVCLFTYPSFAPASYPFTPTAVTGPMHPAPHSGNRPASSLVTHMRLAHNSAQRDPALRDHSSKGSMRTSLEQHRG